MAGEGGISVRSLPEGIRTRRHGNVRFVFNHCAETRSVAALVPGTDDLLMGARELPPAGVAAWVGDGVRK